MNRPAIRPSIRCRIGARRAQAGVTLIETTTVGAVLAVLTGLAAPSFDQSIQRRHLEGAATQLETDIHHARMLAVARNAPLRISFESGAAGSCYVIHSGAANACGCAADGSAVCSGSAQAERSVFFPAGGVLSLKSNSRSVLFDPAKGTSTPTATMRVQARNGAAIHQVMNVMGRVRSCSPEPALSGYRRC
ncbi:MAG TPA: GspH/FimT family pseudopilin [Rubrivivax sp.]|nr:GspH/FimT family pseudopilin [Rubrivivax sp.]